MAANGPACRGVSPPIRSIPNSERYYANAGEMEMETELMEGPRLQCGEKGHGDPGRWRGRMQPHNQQPPGYSVWKPAMGGRSSEPPLNGNDWLELVSVTTQRPDRSLPAFSLIRFDKPPGG